MSEETIVRYCAPTLAGLKPASLFTYVYREEEEELKQSLRVINRRLRRFGLKMIPLCQIQDSQGRRKSLLYLYRPKQLSRQLYDESGRAILEHDGYVCTSLDADLCRLISRFAPPTSFPHEIGLFLGYPAEDVNGFITNQGKHYKMSGYWKVYGDEKQAARRFERYRKCTAVYCARMAQGASLDSLIVSDTVRS